MTLGDIDFIFPTRNTFNPNAFIKDGFKYDDTTRTYVCSLDLPGTNKTNTSINIEDDIMFIKATRSNGQIYDRMIVVPISLNPESLKATHVDGVLTIRAESLNLKGKKKSVTIL